MSQKLKRRHQMEHSLANVIRRFCKGIETGNTNGKGADADVNSAPPPRNVVHPSEP